MPGVAQAQIAKPAKPVRPQPPPYPPKKPAVAESDPLDFLNSSSPSNPHSRPDVASHRPLPKKRSNQNQPAIIGGVVVAVLVGIILIGKMTGVVVLGGKNPPPKASDNIKSTETPHVSGTAAPNRKSEEYQRGYDGGREVGDGYVELMNAGDPSAVQDARRMYLQQLMLFQQLGGNTDPSAQEQKGMADGIRDSFRKAGVKID